MEPLYPFTLTSICTKTINRTPSPPGTGSIGLAHILCESLAHPLGYFSSELRTSSEKIPQADSRPLSREDHQGLRKEKNGSFVSLPLLTLDLVYLFVFGDLALV